MQRSADGTECDRGHSDNLEDLLGTVMETCQTYNNHRKIMPREQHDHKPQYGLVHHRSNRVTEQGIV